MILTVVLSIAGNNQSPKERDVPWKPQFHSGISPLEQSSYLIGRDARLISEVMVMTSVTFKICAARALESSAAELTVKAAGGGEGGGGKGGGGEGGFGGGGGYISSTTVTTLKDVSETLTTPETRVVKTAR